MFSIHEKFISTICGGGAQRIGGGAEPNLAPPLATPLILEICIKILRKPDLIFYNLACQYKGFQIPNLDEIRHKTDLFKKKRLKKREEFRISL